MATKELKKLRYNQYKVFSVKDQRGKTLYGGVVGEGTDYMKIIPAGSYKNKSEVIKRAKQIIKSQNKYIDERKDFKMKARKTTTKRATAKSKSKKLTAAQKRMKKKGLVSVEVSVKGYDATRYKKKAMAKKSTAKKTTAKRKTTARKRTAGKQTKLF